ncbi:MAG: adenosylcobinamide-GDP ribazoletransferase [Candidatus Binatia bacterium]
MRLVRDLGDALGFLTLLPVARRRRLADAPVGFGAAAFPLVGLLLGLLAFATDAATGFLPERLRDIEILLVWAIATGALHYDGLADTLDALGGRDREERLMVMRDGSIGSFAALGLLMAVAAKLSALELLGGADRARALLAAPMLGRWAMLVTAFRAPAARPDGLGASFVRTLEPRAIIIATSMIALAISFLAGARGFAVSAIVAAGALLVRRLAVTAFGGVTGDVLGASGEVAEVLALVFFAAWS